MIPDKASGKVMVGLSGGVDSAVAALLLKRQGRHVSGLFMKNWEEDDGSPWCTAKQDLEDAERVCQQLDIELHTANFAAEYWDDVFAEFLIEYRAGRTPNPDVLCNREIKFKQFARYARVLGAEHIATGHYARLQRQDGQIRLCKGQDANKDQSYFLQGLKAEQLERVLFPLGDLRKQAVRRIAREYGLHNHARKDSTGICFIGERRFREFLQRYVPPNPGPLVDEAGVEIGTHAGLAYYTRGQRRGLAIGGRAGCREAPWYVLDKDLTGNRLVVTQNPDALLDTWLSTGKLHWIGDPAPLPLRCSARIRYRQADQTAWVEASDEGVRVQFEQPQRAITPGQYVCLYEGDVCLGGGVIERFGRQPT